MADESVIELGSRHAFVHDCPSVTALDRVGPRDRVVNLSVCDPHHYSWCNSFRNQAMPLFLAQNLESCVELVKKTVLALHLLDTMLV